MKINIAIDGPSAAGKSTVAKELAKRLGYTHLDTGSMYRAVAYITKEANIKIDDEEKIVNLINMSNIEISNDNHITVNGKDITEIIRSNEISMAASDVSKLKRVREALVAMQRKIASQKGYILDGRDIGTVVLNDAEVKIYLIASAETRAQRRVLQNKEKGIPYDYEQILEDIKKRDYQDIHRKESPLKKAEDAIEIDSSDMTQEEVILENKPGLFASIIGPIVSISLLVLRPIAGIEIDPIIALPVGGIVGCLAMGKYKDFISLSTLGLDKMSSVVLLLLGTGTISGIISNSSIQEVVIGFVEHVGPPGFMLAPIAGITMGAATASATAGSSVGGNIFGESILASGVAPLQAAQMIYTGTIWFDSLPHGSFFHVSCGSVNMKIKQRLKLLPYELLIGIAGSIVSVLLYGVIGLNF